MRTYCLRASPLKAAEGVCEEGLCSLPLCVHSGPLPPLQPPGRILLRTLRTCQQTSEGSVGGSSEAVWPLSADVPSVVGPAAGETGDATWLWSQEEQEHCWSPISPFLSHGEIGWADAFPVIMWGK